MKIAFIGQKGIPATYGGIERFTEEVSSRLVRLGNEVTVYTRPHYLKASEKEHGKSLEWITENTFLWKGVFGKVIPSIPTKHLDALSHTLLCSLDTLFRGFEIIIYQAIGPSSLTFIPRFFGKSQVVTILHSLDWKRRKWGPLARTLLRIAEFPSILFPHRVFVISDILKEYFLKQYKKETLILTPGIKIASQIDGKNIQGLGLSPQEYILFLNRMVPEKGCHYLLEAFSKIKTEKTLVIAGDNSQDPSYFESLRRLYMRERILFLGYVKKEIVPALYSNALLYVLPSEVEGLPQTLLEAAAYGCPILASDIPENLKILGENGFYFRKGDEEDLANKLEYFLKNLDTLMNRAALFKDYVNQTYSWDRTCSALLEGIRNA